MNGQLLKGEKMGESDENTSLFNLVIGDMKVNFFLFCVQFVREFC